MREFGTVSRSSDKKCFSSLLTGEQFISFKEEKEKIFFSEEDEFSISIQYFESNDVVKDYKNGVG